MNRSGASFSLFSVTGLDLWGVLVATGAVCIVYCTLVSTFHTLSPGFSFLDILMKIITDVFGKNYTC